MGSYGLKSAVNPEDCANSHACGNKKIKQFHFFFTIIEKTCLPKQKYCLKKKKASSFPSVSNLLEKPFFFIKGKKCQPKLSQEGKELYMWGLYLSELE